MFSLELLFSTTQCLNATVINENKSFTANVDRMSQYVPELSSFSSNTSLLSLAPLPDSSVNYVLIKMLPFVHDALTQLFNVLQFYLIYPVLHDSQYNCMKK